MNLDIKFWLEDITRERCPKDKGCLSSLEWELLPGALGTVGLLTLGKGSNAPLKKFRES